MSLLEQPEKPRILVVDDDPDILRLSEIFLGKKFHVTTAVDGNDALGKALSSNFDAVVSDIRMPGKTGPEWVREFFKQTRRQLKVLFLSAKHNENLDSLVTDGVLSEIHFLPKPFRNAAVVAKIQELLGA